MVIEANTPLDGLFKPEHLPLPWLSQASQDAIDRIQRVFPVNVDSARVGISISVLILGHLHSHRDSNSDRIQHAGHGIHHTQHWVHHQRHGVHHTHHRQHGIHHCHGSLHQRHHVVTIHRDCQRASCATCRRDPCTLLHERLSADSARSQTMQRH